MGVEGINAHAEVTGTQFLNIVGSSASENFKDDFVIVDKSSDTIVVDNGLIKVTFNKNGQISRLVDCETGFEVVN